MVSVLYKCKSPHINNNINIKSTTATTQTTAIATIVNRINWAKFLAKLCHIELPKRSKNECEILHAINMNNNITRWWCCCAVFANITWNGEGAAGGRISDSQRKKNDVKICDRITFLMKHNFWMSNIFFACREKEGNTERTHITVIYIFIRHLNQRVLCCRTHTHIHTHEKRKRTTEQQQ